MKKIGMWGSIASIVGVGLYFVPDTGTSNNYTISQFGKDAVIEAESISQTTTGPKSPNINVEKGSVEIQYNSESGDPSPELNGNKMESPPKTVIDVGASEIKKLYVSKNKSLTIQVISTSVENRYLVIEALVTYVKPIMGDVAYLKLQENSQTYCADMRGARHYLVNSKGIDSESWFDFPLKIPTEITLAFELNNTITAPLSLVVNIEGKTDNEFHPVAKFTVTIHELGIPYMYVFK